MHSRMYLLITTHTTLHLERVLLGVRHSSRLPDEIAISCDNDKAELRELAVRRFKELGLKGSIVMREHMGVCRLAQVINNGLRFFGSLPGSRAIGDDDRVIVIQGDCCPGKEFLATHMTMGEKKHLVVGFRHDITEEQSDRFSEEALLAGRDPVGLTAEQIAAIDDRHRRFTWHARLRRFGLAKSHKPKLLGADFSVRFGAWKAINGMDEEYVGYGSEDDDLSRRLYANGASVAVGVKQLELYHLWHQTRKGQAWEASSGVARFKMATPVKAVHGISNPLGQAEVKVWELG